MADEKKTEQAEAPPAGPSKVVLIISMIVPGLLAGGASFAGSMMGAAQGAAAAAPATSSSAQADVPGPTVKLAPFVLSVRDDKGGAHPMKVSIAVELAAGSAEADFDSYEPRVRDATIRLLRNLSYDQASNKETHDGLRDSLLAALKELGVTQAQQIWFVDFVIQ